jgi:hypothetical protein
VKKLITMLTLLAMQTACHSTTPTPGPAPRPGSSNGALTGAADAPSAVRTFMGAAKQQDLQALGGIWGDANGPARDAISREELEKRELIMLKCLRHDRYDIVGDAPSAGGSRVLVVALTYKGISQSTNFTTIRGPANRWYVEKFDLEPLQKICATM